jgi:diketogulonate reductase-like aldo/keto reductase
MEKRKILLRLRMIPLATLLCTGTFLVPFLSSRVQASDTFGECASPSTPLDIPTVTLSNGVEMPLLHLGTAQLNTVAGKDPKLPPSFVGMIPERGYRQIELALQKGIRAFDTALIYRSSRQIGAVLGEWWRAAKLQDRSEVWLSTKVFHPNATETTFGLTHLPDMHEKTPEQITVETRRHFEQALMDLGVGYVDLMLLHWPASAAKEEGNSQDNRQRRLAAWRVLEDLYENKGWARAIGVSNFSPQHLNQLQQDGARIVPMVNQFEASITLQYPDLVQYCKDRGIIPQAYSPLGRGLAELPLQVAEMAEKHGKDVGQIAFRYLYQLGYAIISLSNSPQRMVSNSEIFDFELSDADMRLLNSLNRPDGGWGLPSPYEIE